MRALRGERTSGPFGWAQHVTVPDHPSAPVTVSTWFMHLPDQGIGYDKFLLNVVTLEDMPGLPPPARRYPGAEYELHVVALDPDRQPRVDDPGTWSHMLPGNVVEQFHGINRHQAGRVARAAAHACVQGRLPAETQVYVEMPGQPPKMMTIAVAVTMWRNAVARTVEHERTGGLHERAN